MDNYQPEQLYFLRYENLKTDLIPQLRNIMSFLEVEMDETVENCVLQSKEGSNKREKPSIDLRQFYRKVLKRQGML